MPRRTNTRQLLLEAAIAVIEAEGEAALKVDDIAAAANVTKPSVYHFFGDRGGLVVAALAEIYLRSTTTADEELLDGARRATTRQEYAGVLSGIIRSFAGEEGRQRRAMRASVLGAAVDRPRLQQALVARHRESNATRVELARIGQDKGFLDPAFDTGVIALFSMMMLAGRHYAEIDETVDLAEWDAVVIETLRHLMFDGPQPS